jgi:HK97 family phage major capsid protein
LTAAENAGRDLTADEQRRVKELHGRCEKLAEDRNEAAGFERARTELRRQSLEASGRVPVGKMGSNWTGGGSVQSGMKRFQTEPALRLMDEHGKWHDALACSQPMFAAPEASVPTWGEEMAFRLTNDERHLRGKSAMMSATTTGDSGGYFVPTAISGQIIDKMRSMIATGRAGVSTINMLSPQMTVCRVLTDPTGNWVHELGEITASAPTFGTIELKTRKIGFLVKIPRELTEDAPNLPEVLERVTLATLAHDVDQVILTGSNVGAEPGGIINTDGVSEAPSVGTPADWTDLTSAVRQLYTANYQGDVEDLAFIQSPTEWLTFADLQDTTNQPLAKPPAIAGLPMFTTTAMPTGTALLGHFPSAVLGIREGRGVSVEFLNSGSAIDDTGTTYNAVSQDFRWMRVTMRLAVGVLRPDHFVKLTGITAA